MYKLFIINCICSIENYFEKLLLKQFNSEIYLYRFGNDGLGIMMMLVRADFPYW